MSRCLITNGKNSNRKIQFVQKGLRGLKKLILVSLFIVMGSSMIFGQAARRNASIRGRIIDMDTDMTVEYANVLVNSLQDSTLVNGGMSDDQGYFRVENLVPGSYYVEVKFIGYEDYIFHTVRIDDENPQVDLGNIPLKKSVIHMDGVQVEAERPIINYEIDKKVIDVRKQATSESGTAVDLLQNVPSVDVDFDGNVSLRGSSSFTVLIDGRPTILDANDALAQIPASTIEQIEIITNPSVKYDPEGIAGIMNIVTIKKKLTGVSGIVNARYGSNNDPGGDFLLSFKHEKFNWFVKGMYRGGEHPGTSESSRTTTVDTLTTILESQGSSNRDRNFAGVQTGIEYYPGKNDVLSLSARIGDFRMGEKSTLDYTEQRLMPSDSLDLAYTGVEDGSHGGTHLSASLSWDHNFEQEGHKLSAQVNFMNRNGSENSTNEEFDSNHQITSGQINTEKGPMTRVQYRSDYEKPLGDFGKLELGLEGNAGDNRDMTTVKDYIDGAYVVQDSLARDARYRQNINGVYALVNQKYGNIGIQGGLRMEYTYRKISTGDNTDVFTINRPDYFPSLHTSYDLGNGDQLMASYTRRIQRPRGWYLEPFRTRMDSRNVWEGNPGLLPSYTNSVEGGYKKVVGNNDVYFDLFYRQTLDEDERITEPLTADLYLNTVKNVGTSTSAGLEASVNLIFRKFWSLYLTSSVYDYRLAGEYVGVADTVVFDTHDTSWNARFNNTFRLNEKCELQVMTRYRSGRVTSQGRDDARYQTDLSLKYQILRNKLTANFQVRDVFGTGVHESTSSGANFTSHSLHTHDAPYFSLSLKYNFNNYQEKPGGGQNGGGGDTMDNGGDY